jgi:hypothetical protein
MVFQTDSPVALIWARGNRFVLALAIVAIPIGISIYSIAIIIAGDTLAIVLVALPAGAAKSANLAHIRAISL